MKEMKGKLRMKESRESQINQTQLNHIFMITSKFYKTNTFKTILINNLKQKLDLMSSS